MPAMKKQAKASQASPPAKSGMTLTMKKPAKAKVDKVDHGAASPGHGQAMKKVKASQANKDLSKVKASKDLSKVKGLKAQPLQTPEKVSEKVWPSRDYEQQKFWEQVEFWIEKHNQSPGAVQYKDMSPKKQGHLVQAISDMLEEAKDVEQWFQGVRKKEEVAEELKKSEESEDSEEGLSEELKKSYMTQRTLSQFF